MNKKQMDQKISEMLNNSDIVKVMKKASSKFNKQLTSEEMYTSEINALWRAIVNFKPEKNTKFTTYLYRGVTIDCIKQVKFKEKLSKKATGKLHGNIPCKLSNHAVSEILDEADNEYDREILMDKLSNLTILEMAQKRNISRETVRLQAKKIFENIRKRHS